MPHHHMLAHIINVHLPNTTEEIEEEYRCNVYQVLQLMGAH